jgi:hypothetical protein
LRSGRGRRAPGGGGGELRAGRELGRRPAATRDGGERTPGGGLRSGRGRRAPGGRLALRASELRAGGGLRSGQAGSWAGGRRRAGPAGKRTGGLR